MKKGQGIQFNWIFVIIAGVIILAFFATFAVRFKDIQDRKDNAEIARGIDNLFYGLSATTQYNSIDSHWTFNFKYNCDHFIINDDYIQDLDNKIIFSAKEVNTDNILIWTKEFKKPFFVANLLYVIDLDKEYYLIGENSLDDFPKSLKINRNSPDKDDKGVFVYFRQPDPVGLNDLKERGSVIWVDGNNIKFLNSGKEAVYYDESTLLAAIFSEDYEEYECGFDRLMNKYDNLRKIYYQKSNYLSTLSNCDYSLAKEILKRNVNQDNLLDFSSSLNQENERLWQNGCEVIF